MVVVKEIKQTNGVDQHVEVETNEDEQTGDIGSSEVSKRKKRKVRTWLSLANLRSLGILL